jgi:spore coat protein U-like protein
MKTLLLSAAVLALASPAFAQSASVDVTATVASTCSITSPGPQSLGAVATDANGKVASQTTTFNFGNVWCNGAGNRMEVQANPLANASVVVDTYSFTNTIHYTLTSGNPALAAYPIDTSSAATAHVDTGGSLPAFETGTGVYSNFTVTTIAQSTKRPVAGTYTGTIYITLYPGV